jgi:RHS repeat-associated protein
VSNRLNSFDTLVGLTTEQSMGVGQVMAARLSRSDQRHAFGVRGIMKIAFKLAFGVFALTMAAQVALAQSELPPPSRATWYTVAGGILPVTIATAPTPDGACRLQRAAYSPSSIYYPPVKLSETLYACQWSSVFAESLPSTVTGGCDLYHFMRNGICVDVRTQSPECNCNQGNVPSAPPTPVVGNPVSITTGHKIQAETDYLSADGLFGVVRKYTSNVMRSDSVGHFGFGEAWSGIVPGRLAMYGEETKWVRYEDSNGSPINSFVAVNSGDPNSWTFQHVSFTSRRLSMVTTPTVPRSTFVNEAAVVNGAAEFRLQESNGDYILFRRAGISVGGGRFMVPVEKGLASGYKVFFDYPDGEFYPNKIRDSFGREMVLTWQAANDPEVNGYYADNTYKAISGISLPDGTTLSYTYGQADTFFSNAYTTTGGVVAEVRAKGKPDRLDTVRRKNATGSVIWGRDYLYENKAFAYALTGIKDQNGNRISTYAYDAAGLAASSERAGGVNKYVFKTLQVNLDTYIREVTNPLGRTERYTMVWQQTNPLYDIPRAITTVEGLATSTVPADLKTFEYQASPGYIDYSLKAIVDRNNVRTDYAVDMGVWRRPDAATEATGKPEQRQTNITYVPDRNLPATEVRPGVTTSYTYTPLGQILTRTDTDTTTHTTPYATTGQARTTSYSWTAQGRLASVNGPLPVTAGKDDLTSFVYDAQGNLQTMTNGLAHVTSFAGYDANGRPGTMTDPNGIIAAFTYDPLGRVLTVNVKHPTTTASDAITSFEYDGEGRVIGITRPATDKLIIDYNLGGQMTAIRAASGERIDYVNDAMGNVTAETTKRTNATVAKQVTRTFDSLGRMLTEVLGPGRSTGWTYDKEGNPTQVVTPRNNATVQAFDGLNRLVSAVAPDTGTTALTYTVLDDVKTHTDPISVQTTYVRNGFGDVIQEVSPDRGTSTFYYDAAGTMTARIDGRGQRIDYVRDILGRVVTTTPVGRPASEVVTYSYDAGGLGSYQKGRLAKLVDGSGTTTFQYDHRGNMLVKRQAIGSTTAANLTYAYDLGDRVTQITYPSGRLVGYVRDTKGRVTTVRTKATSTVTAWTNLATSMSYEPFGALKQATLGNTLSMTSNWGNDGRLASRRLYVTSGGVNLSLLTYAYDNDDNITGITDGVDATKSLTYAYDVNGRLVRTDVAAGSLRRTDYAYDRNGNRLSAARRALPGDANPVESDGYALSAGTNRLASITMPSGTRSIAYDGRGNPTGETRPAAVSVTTAYDGYARLTSYTRTGEANLAHVYNGLDDRVATTRGTDTRRFVTDADGRAIGEYGTSATDVKAEFIWMSAEVANDNQPFGGDDGTGGYAPLAVVEGTTLKWVHGNHLGVPVTMTDAAGTALALGGDYMLPGFPGQSRTLADLYYNRHRDYDPTTGRYIQADPIGLAGGANPYVYAENNPVRWTDPSGRFVPLVIVGICAGGGCEAIGIGVAVIATLILTRPDPNCPPVLERRKDPPKSRRGPRYTCPTCGAPHGGSKGPECPDCDGKRNGGYPTDRPRNER